MRFGMAMVGRLSLTLAALALTAIAMTASVGAHNSGHPGHPPAAPNLVSASLQSGAVVLRWTAPVDSVVTGYRVFRTNNAGETTEFHELKPDVLTITDQYVPQVPGASYTYTIVAVNESGDGEPSNARVVTLPSDVDSDQLDSPTESAAAAANVVPACTPWPGSSVDPCERRVPWERPKVGYPPIPTSLRVPNPPLTIRGAMDQAFGFRLHVPHIIVRAIVAPGSTRCESQTGRGRYSSDPSKPHRWIGDAQDIRCYSDIAIREYLVGSGPNRVTLLTGLRRNDDQHISYGTFPRDAAYLAYISEPLAEDLEGREWIFWLTVPYDPSNLAWDSWQYWSVQRLANGTVAVVDRWSGHHSDSDQTTYQSRLEIPLADYATQVQAAHAHYQTLYGGKVDALDGAPSLITSADPTALEAYLRAEGVHDTPKLTPAPPPPPPWGAAEVPACTPWPGSAIDPCEHRVRWTWPKLRDPLVDGVRGAPNPPLTVRGAVDFAFERRSSVPHIIARGIVVPGSTRCAVQEGAVLFDDSPSASHRWLNGVRDIRCYSEIAVREYLVGSGPTRVTLLTGLRNNDQQHHTYGSVPRDADYFAYISEPLVEALEGREWIYWLELPNDLSNETWDSWQYWSVQKLANGAVVAVDFWSGRYSDSEQSKYQSRLEMPLASYSTQVKAAHAHYVTLYGGKVDAADGAPSLIASADTASLKAYLRAEGVYDVPGFTASPPPPPRPAPPNLISASLRYNGEVRLRWTASQDSVVTGYKVLRTDGAGETTEVRLVKPNFVTYPLGIHDRNVPQVPGARYTYTIVAVNQTGESEPSNAEGVALPCYVASVHCDLPTEVADGTAAVVPACTPWPGSTVDICERRVPWPWPELRHPAVSVLIGVPHPPQTLREEMDEAFKRRDEVPHIVARAVVVPGSARCGAGRRIYCYSELAVREYLVGSGPERVTLLTNWRDYDGVLRDGGTVPRDAAYFAHISEPTVEALEGREWIFWLNTPLNPAIEAWHSWRYWSVQKLDDGTILAVSQWSGHQYDSDQSTYLSRLEIPLASYATQVKAAHAHYRTLYAGKVDGTEGAPDLITSADVESLKAYQRAEGVYDRPGFTPSPTPPPPWESAAIPPCQPWGGSSVDPCERRVPWPWPELKYPAIEALSYVPNPPLTLTEEMDDAFNYRDDVPHIVVRGVVAPGSTRCRLQSGRGITPGDPNEDLRWMADTSNIRCYSEVAVREYLIGSGPERVTVMTGRRNNDGVHRTIYGDVPRDEAYFADISEPLVEALEGREWIFWLEVPLDPATETWDSSRYWSVQKLDDGTILAVSKWSGHHSDSDQSTYQSRLEIPLADYSTQVKAAHAHYVTLYGGKVDGSDGAPDLIASADTASLKAYLRAEGVYDVPGFTASPPPPPPPTAPILANAWPQSDGDVMVWWTVPQDSVVTGYRVLRTDGAGETSEVLIVKPEYESFYLIRYDRNVPQVSGASYTYTIVAVNQNGESVPSNAKSVTLP